MLFELYKGEERKCWWCWEILNETEVLEILGSLDCFSLHFVKILLVGSDSSNVISWISSNKNRWRFHFLFAEIKSLSSHGYVKLKHVKRLANTMADSLAKQGVHRVISLIAYTM